MAKVTKNQISLIAQKHECKLIDAVYIEDRFSIVSSNLSKQERFKRMVFIQLQVFWD